jgi:hypothetical protein
MCIQHTKQSVVIAPQHEDAIATTSTGQFEKKQF